MPIAKSIRLSQQKIKIASRENQLCIGQKDLDDDSIFRMQRRV